ncbi:class I SAM-dependent methyltransferase [Pseudomonas sp. dw_358]|uniref:class I SAM-dependent methyltransferase n=1 Tax=Pseudomonas sp. dw_358 TaxID=2720083 RepID=UPI001BD1F154
MGNPAQLKLPPAFATAPESAAALRAASWTQRRQFKLTRKALALAGDPGLVLDLPCGAGRFWPLLTGKSNRVVIAADTTLDALETALAAHGSAVLDHIRPLQTALAPIDLSDNAVDSILCMHSLQQITDPERRMALLRECYRVSRDTVIVALWSDPALSPWRHRHQAGAAKVRAEAEVEFRQAGFKIQARLDTLACWSMARIYLLRKP